jgi:hypothetical protein
MQMVSGGYRNFLIDETDTSAVGVSYLDNLYRYYTTSRGACGRPLWWLVTRCGHCGLYLICLMYNFVVAVMLVVVLVVVVLVVVVLVVVVNSYRPALLWQFSTRQ